MPKITLTNFRLIVQNHNYLANYLLKDWAAGCICYTLISNRCHFEDVVFPISIGLVSLHPKLCLIIVSNFKGCIFNKKT